MHQMSSWKQMWVKPSLHDTCSRNSHQEMIRDRNVLSPGREYFLQNGRFGSDFTALVLSMRISQPLTPPHGCGCHMHDLRQQRDETQDLHKLKVKQTAIECQQGPDNSPSFMPLETSPTGVPNCQQPTAEASQAIGK